MWVVVLTLLVCLVQSILKGWWSLVLLPASLIVLPLVFLLQRVALQTQRRTGSTHVKVVRLGQLAALLAFYVGLVGFGDTNDVLLFGFMVADLHDPLTDWSWNLCAAGFFLTPILTIWLLIAWLRQRDEPSLQNSQAHD